VEAIKKHRKIPTEEILTNKEINYGRFQKELGKPKLDTEQEKQRPDIQFWADISSDEDKFETWKLYII
jgi:tRNA U54 and U55 pseudouridine synthase Pus10